MSILPSRSRVLQVGQPQAARALRQLLELAAVEDAGALEGQVRITPCVEAGVWEKTIASVTLPGARYAASFRADGSRSGSAYTRCRSCGLCVEGIVNQSLDTPTDRLQLEAAIVALFAWPVACACREGGAR